MEKKKSQTYVNDIYKIADNMGIYVPYDLKLGVRISEDPDSVYGEKTKGSMIEKATRKILIEGDTEFRLYQLSDAIRTKTMVDRYEHIPAFLDLLRKAFPDLLGELPHYPKRGYRGIHLGTNRIDGLCADLQVSTALQGIIDNVTHGLYGKLRQLSPDSMERAQIEQAVKLIYDTYYDNSNFLENDIKIRSKIVDMGEGFAQTDLTRLPKYLLRELRKPPFKIKNNRIVMEEDRLDDQAEMMHDFAMSRQPKLTKLSEDIFTEYKRKLRIGDLDPRLTKTQLRINNLFENALGEKIERLRSVGIIDPRKEIRDNYGEVISEIETARVIPAISKGASRGTRP